MIAGAFPGWTLTDIKSMTYRERKYWLRMLKWKREKARA